MFDLSAFIGKSGRSRTVKSSSSLMCAMFYVEDNYWSEQRVFVVSRSQRKVPDDSRVIEH